MPSLPTDRWAITWRVGARCRTSPESGTRGNRLALQKAFLFLKRQDWGKNRGFRGSCGEGSSGGKCLLPARSSSASFLSMHKTAECCTRAVLRTLCLTITLSKDLSGKLCLQMFVPASFCFKGLCLCFIVRCYGRFF